MSARDRFGPNLRRIREQRRITLEQIADSTNVDVELWAGMEANDFSRWPSGIFARAFIREYARIIGVDAESTVDEFCRYFPVGDRRRGHILRAEAELLGVQSEWHDDQIPERKDRRSAPAAKNLEESARDALLARRSRIAAAAIDIGVSAAAGVGIARLLGFPVWPVLGGVALAYHATGIVFMGTTPGATLVSTWMRQRTAAALRRIAGTALPRLRRNLRAARS
jgi:transcriptional regulator with XRE-family HTH domain